MASNSKRWDLCVSHKKGDKWMSNKIGVIFEGDNGQLQIKIDPGVSVSTPEGVNLTGWLPKPKDERGGSRGGGGNDSGGYSGGGRPADDSDLPF